VKVIRTGGNNFALRAAPSLASEVVGSLGFNKRYKVVKVIPNGEVVADKTRWFKVKKKNGKRGYIPVRKTRCVDSFYADSAFLLPFKCGDKIRVTQGNNSAFSHNGRSQYAFDFGVPVGTPVKAAKKGVVIYRRNATQPGDACWSYGGPNCITKANYVVLKHPDGSRTMYAHVNKVTVPLGAQVKRGQTIAKSGNTGWSPGPHLHFSREQHCSSSHCQSKKMRFGDVTIREGRPTRGDTVKSGNCTF
jgi:murein DD-endopeptidase MepM/ murein hydrolase activator NlpD